MSAPVATQQVVVRSAHGLHFRPASEIAQRAQRFPCEISLSKEGKRVNGKSPLDILTLVATQGVVLVVEAAGDQAEEAVAAIVDLFESNFPIPPRPTPSATP